MTWEFGGWRTRLPVSPHPHMEESRALRQASARIREMGSKEPPQHLSFVFPKNNTCLPLKSMFSKNNIPIIIPPL